MIPSYEGLKSFNPPALETHDRLVIILEFTPLDGVAKICLQLQPFRSACAHLCVKHLITSPTGRLCTVHCHFRVPQEIFRSLIPSHTECNADTGGSKNLLPVYV